MRIWKPAAATRYPADPRAVFVLALAVFSGLPMVLGKTPEPGSLEEQLPHWGVTVWGVLLLVGCGLTLVGMAFQTINGIVSEQIGSVTVGAATLFYVGLMVAELGMGALNPGVAIILGWGLSCFWRWGQLQSLVGVAHVRGERRAADRLARNEL